MIRSVGRKRLGNAVSVMSVSRRYAHAPVAFNWEDPLDAASLFTEEELAIQETAKSYCQERMLPRVLGMQDILRVLRATSTNPSHSRRLPRRTL